ncbi:uncharacterized protein LOC122135491 [Cyprinus carpio]|uniref:Uncharacterized protein LOC122135491 n=1 Tax=Cyprinus carpio TaxID=7962 RepID=A0A9Q9VTF9_CYPCA|nr:uncharacterized protein LOC122135491 [Cyprinus carpio]
MQLHSASSVWLQRVTMLCSMFWIRANYYRPVDLPDNNGLSWREAIIQCLESVYVRSRGQPNPEPSPPSLSLLFLFTSSPPYPSRPLAPPGYLVPPALPWSGVDHPVPWDSTPPASPRPTGSVRLLQPLGSTSVLCHSGSAAAFQIHASVSVAGAICSALVLWILPIALDSSAICLCLGLLRHLLRRRWSAPWSHQPVNIMAVAWVLPVTACSKSLLPSPWLLLPGGSNVSIMECHCCVLLPMCSP